MGKTKNDFMNGFVRDSDFEYYLQKKRNNEINEYEDFLSASEEEDEDDFFEDN